MSPRKKTASTPGGASKRSTTEREPSGQIMRVDNPLDLWYLCEKIGYAQRFPKIRSDGQLMYQRVVTQLIRLDDKLFDYHFPYIGEVGYDMTRNPPAPIMSRRNPNRPSEFPLGRYIAIKKRFTGHILESVRVERTRELLSLGELENDLNPGMRNQNGDAKALPDFIRKQLENTKGLFRIPDVIRIRNLMLTGELAFRQDNLQTLIEIKFDTDELSDDQAKAYLKIAGDRSKFRLLETHICKVDDRRKRQWIRDAQKEPVYRPVAQAGSRNNVCLRPDVEAYPLLEGQVEQEFQNLQRYLNPQLPTHSGGPQLVPIDPAQEAQRERDRQRGQATVGMALGGPMFTVGGAVLLVEAGGAVVSAGGAAVASDLALVGRIAGQVVRYGREVVPWVAALGSTSYATAEVTESAHNDTHADRRWLYDFTNDSSRTEQAYLYWPD